MVPIARDTGSVIAFGGRALEKDQVPKYLQLARDAALQQEPHALRAEPHQGRHAQARLRDHRRGLFRLRAGVPGRRLPVVATCGTALTAAAGAACCAASRRRRCSATTRIQPDRRAAERSSELLVGEGFDVNVVRLPEGEDPDTFVQKRGREALRPAAQDLPAVSRFLLDRAAAGQDLTRDEPRREFLRKMLTVAARIPDPATRDQFADRLAHKARVTEEVVRAEIRKAAAARKTELPAASAPIARRAPPAAEAGPAVGAHPPAGAGPRRY